jgi:hypothetical protein
MAKMDRVLAIPFASYSCTEQNKCPLGNLLKSLI